ncbi:MAG: glucose-1-phosphate thymidylyltransferase [Planctomycetota bacterium]|nr:MAG: glucose-1-phosphate thymidylyltransferase [Planctomycetota bacterium]
MSNPFAPDALFELDGFAHRDLFAGVESAWEALGERLARYLESHARRALEGTVEDGAVVKGAVWLAPGATIEAGAYVNGPAIIGPGAVVRHGAYLRENVIAGAGAILGHATEVKNAVFLDQASAGHFAYVGDSILGRRANLGAGTKLANFRVFPGEVRVCAPDGRSVATGMQKLGALVGDDVQIGCNAVTAPGTVIGRGSVVYSLASVRGTLPPRTLVSYKPELRRRPLREPR